MKTRLTQKEIRDKFSQIIAIGYCDAQSLLAYRSPNWYNDGVYGWNYDAYDMGGGTCIVTGSRPIGAMRIPWDELHALDLEAERIINDCKMDYEEKKTKVEGLLKKAISMASN